MICALLVVGLVSHTLLRHVVQTSPLWIAVVLSARESPSSRWAALPCFVVWLALMTVVWLYLLGWIHPFSGTFTRSEIALTVVVGAAALVGIREVAATISPGVGARRALAVVAVVGCLQLVMLRLSFLPALAHR